MWNWNENDAAGMLRDANSGLPVEAMVAPVAVARVVTVLAIAPLVVPVVALVVAPLFVPVVVFVVVVVVVSVFVAAEAGAEIGFAGAKE